jgi:hypothetical protein
MRPEAIEPAREFARRITRRIRVEAVYLFGSRACMIEPRPDADWDFIVVSPDFEGLHPVERWRMCFAEFGPVQADVDFVCLTPQEFAWQRAHATIVADAIQYAVRLDGDEGYGGATP